MKKHQFSLQEILRNPDSRNTIAFGKDKNLPQYIIKSKAFMFPEDQLGGINYKVVKKNFLSKRGEELFLSDQNVCRDHFIDLSAMEKKTLIKLNEQKQNYLLLINRIVAIADALDVVKEKANILLYTDSSPIIRAFRDGLIFRWKKGGFKKPVYTNGEYERIYHHCTYHNVFLVHEEKGRFEVINAKEQIQLKIPELLETGRRYDKTHRIIWC